MAHDTLAEFSITYGSSGIELHRIIDAYVVRTIYAVEILAAVSTLAGVDNVTAPAKAISRLEQVFGPVKSEFRSSDMRPQVARLLMAVLDSVLRRDPRRAASTASRLFQLDKVRV